VGGEPQLRPRRKHGCCKQRERAEKFGKGDIGILNFALALKAVEPFIA
jgi:hypothetical protein